MHAVVKRILDHFEEDVAGLLMGALLVVLTLQVVARVLNTSVFFFTEEVSRHLFIVLVFFGAAGAIRDRSHISINIFVGMLPAWLRLAVALACNALVLLFLAVLVYWGWRATVRLWDIPTTTLEMPSGLIYAAIPVTAVLMILRTLKQMAEDVAAGDPARVPSVQPSID
jgi:TRAP-type C4-dicarboxylate transport system permease small subunit